jgi:uncharacterized protein YjbI with pentapeptide repeats
LPGLAALIALVFTFQSIKATDTQLRIAEQGQITDRYNAAITNLGSSSIEVRLGGIYALQRLMQDSPRDQPTVIAVLCAFIRDQTASAAKPPTSSAALPPTDIQAALTVVATRNTANDGRTTTVDLNHTQLANSQVGFGNLAHANLTGANFTGATFTKANLTGANFTAATLTGATLIEANLTGAGLSGADLTHVLLFHANLAKANLGGADLAHADLFGANFTGAYLNQANLHGVAHANFRGADLTRVRPEPLVPGELPP